MIENLHNIQKHDININVTTQASYFNWWRSLKTFCQEFQFSNYFLLVWETPTFIIFKLKINILVDHFILNFWYWVLLHHHKHFCSMYSPVDALVWVSGFTLLFHSVTAVFIHSYPKAMSGCSGTNLMGHKTLCPLCSVAFSVKKHCSSLKQPLQTTNRSSSVK